MSKRIPIALQEHKDSRATTLTLIMKVSCVGKYKGVVRGFTQLDDDVLYDDGKGPLLYKCDQGLTPSVIDTSADFGVDNAEMGGWVQEDELSESDIFAGMFDFAEVTIYEVNYNDLRQGHHEIVASGTFGQTRFNENRWWMEWRGLQQIAKQPYGECYSLTCRAAYGSERCGLPLEWIDVTVTAVSPDFPDRIFSIAGIEGEPDGKFVPGVVRVVEGLNAGREMEIDAQDEESDIRLALPMAYPFAIGDKLRIRIDCDKTFETCKARGNQLRFRGEHHTPVSDPSLFVPGANMKSQDAQ